MRIREVLVIAGAALAVATLVGCSQAERFGVLGCRREAQLCTVFDSATGQFGLVPLPLYPGEKIEQGTVIVPPVAPKPKQEV